jgi:uncharacterized membrane protein
MARHLPKLHSDLPRFDAVDALRGFAMAWMTAFHFCFDLNQAGYIHQNFYTDPVWTWQRTCILGLFLLCAGAGQAIALHQGQTWPRFWRRWAQIAGCALLVSAGSALMFGKSFIYFGVLHGMAVMLLLVRLTAGWGRWLWPLGVLAVASKFIAAHAISTWPVLDFLNDPGWNALGLISRLPVTQDYVPVLPWLGVMWWGMALCQWWLNRQKTPSERTKTSAAPVRALALLGRWSLSYYMLHQPVLLAGLWLFKQV